MAKLRYTYKVPKAAKTYWRFRRGKLHAPLPGQPGDPAFHAEYGRLLALSEAPSNPKGPEEISVSWLIGRYRESVEFSKLRPPTQLDYNRTLDLIDRELGDAPFKLMTTKMVKTVRDDYARKTPRKADKIRQMVSALYTWAAGDGHVATGVNPAAAIKKLKVREKSYIPWSEEEIALYLAHCPPFLRTAVLVTLCTGQRVEDVVQMEWPAYQRTIVRVIQSKTGTELMIGCHKQLREHLDKVKTRFSGKIVRNAKGRPMSANALNKAIVDFGKKIEGWPGNRSPHGLRYAAAGRLEEAGVTPADAASILGHRTYAMAMKYLAQRKASEASMRKVEQL